MKNLLGKSSINGEFSIGMFDYQRVHILPRCSAVSPSPEGLSRCKDY
jgi:hypothetical protein